MPLSPFFPGQSVTSDMLLIPLVYQEIVDGGPSVGGDQLILSTLTVPDLGIPTIQVASASWTGNPTTVDAANARWVFRVREDDTSGTILGNSIIQLSNMTGSANRFTFNVASCAARSIPSGVSATYVVTIQRSVGTGVINTPVGGDGWLTVYALPDPASA